MGIRRDVVAETGFQADTWQQQEDGSRAFAANQAPGFPPTSLIAT
jgi:hypothetical protein